MVSESDSAVDVFDMEQPVPPPESEPSAPAATKSKKASVSKINLPTDALKKWFVPGLGVCAFVVACLWIFAPGLLPNFDGPPLGKGGESKSSSAAQALPNPLAAMQQMAATSSVAPVSAPVAAQTVVTPEPTTAVPEQPVKADVRSDDAQVQGRFFALESSIRELQAKVALLEGAQSSRSIDPARGSGSAANSQPPKRKADGVTTTNAKTRKPATADAKSEVISKTFTLNTIYAGQAWIQNSEQMFVVRENDYLEEQDGLRILKIDSKLRRVMTNKGVIR
ncbi:hypothetical protein [Pseudomonas siliginis]|uniref:hypothetical protein n=1 Tax=Pseudomonas siliginis TaxID=2842346 RepID=UPI002092720B|nr:hypothetical protein [Pseudomonas siliginis]UST77267.1 hypothetical protein NF676_00360 [Pseudomonas siliginis]